MVWLHFFPGDVFVTVWQVACEFSGCNGAVIRSLANFGDSQNGLPKVQPMS
jgi:hypothetical protein